MKEDSMGSGLGEEVMGDITNNSEGTARAKCYTQDCAQGTWPTQL